MKEGRRRHMEEIKYQFYFIFKRRGEKFWKRRRKSTFFRKKMGRTNKEQKEIFMEKSNQQWESKFFMKWQNSMEKKT